MARERAFNEIRDALSEGIAALRSGKVLSCRQVRLPAAPRPMSPGDIVRLRRDKLKVSQVVFARLLNTAPQTIHAWEQGRNRPAGAALRLLRLVDRRPEVVADLLTREEI